MPIGNYRNNMTAMGTAKSGYIQRKIVKVCEDIKIQYDQTVRDTTGKIYEFCYGENGYDATKTIRVDSAPAPCDVSRLIDRLNTSYELGIDDEKVVPPAIFDPPVTSQVIRPASRSVSEEEKKKKLVGKIRKNLPNTVADESWTVEELTQRVESMDIEEDEEEIDDDMDIEKDDDDEVEKDEEEVEKDEEEEELVEEDEVDDDDQGDFEADFDDD